MDSVKHFACAVLAGALLMLRPVLSSSNSDSLLNEPFSSSLAKLDHYACVSLFYRNGRMGCGTADRSVQIGKLDYFDGNLPAAEEPFVAVMEDYMLTAANVQLLMASRQSNGQLQGILVVNATQVDDGDNNNDASLQSLDSQTPQGYGTQSADLNYGYYAYQWNARGQDLFALDLYGIPMAYVPDSAVALTLINEAKETSASSSDKKSSASIVSEFDYYMGPDAMKSAECLAWKDTDGEWAPKCMPLGGSSVWAVAGSPAPAENNNRPVIMVAANLDSTTMFHDRVPAANTAASNILATLMAAKLIGENLSDEDLDALNNRIGFGLFQGESYGFVGSRRFLRDVAYPKFQCTHNPVQSIARDDTNEDYACLSPLRPSLKFAGIASIGGMISVDQVAYALGSGLLYVHADEDNSDYGGFMANVIKASSTNSFSVASTSAQSGDDGYPYPPTPLTSLLSLSEGAVTGAVLTGYDYAFTSTQPYHSIMDDPKLNEPDLEAIASAATILARSVLAAAYDDGSLDSDTSSQYAVNLIPELDASDESFVELADCMFYSGQCSLFNKYAAQELNNERSRTGLDLQGGNDREDPPNYYVGILNSDTGQPFVRVGNKIFGAYEGDDYGKKQTDAFGVVPRAQERAIRGLLNDYLGRGTSSEGGPKRCKALSDCRDVEYCQTNNGRPTCTAGGACVCVRAHYHVALDEGLRAADNEYPGFFVVDENDSYGISPMFTEPFWSSNVSVKVYRKVGPVPGLVALGLGLAMAAASLFGAFVLKVGLKKEKLY